MKSLFASIIIFITLTTTAIAQSEKQVYGYVERVWLPEAGISLKAKLDTGAKSSSLNVIDIREIKEKKTNYLVFRIPDGQGGSVELRQKRVGRVRVKIHSEIGAKLNQSFTRRPIIIMPIRIGNKIRKIRINLTNRENFLYPMLLGRDAIEAFDGIVDPEMTFTVKTKPD